MDLTPEDIALFVAETDQQKAMVRDLAARVREHWADDSGCQLPKCPGGTLARALEGAHPSTIQHLLLSALVLLAEQPTQPTHLPGWCVVDERGTRHEFTGPERAMRYALERAWTDRPTTLESPAGDQWVLLRRHHDVTVFAARAVKPL